jgi:hypothetical protein
MKTKLTLLITGALAIIFSLSPLLLMTPAGQTASANFVDDANAFCTTATGQSTTDKLARDCALGYLEEKKVEAKKSTETRDHFCKTTSTVQYSACAEGWNGAQKGTQPATPNNALAGEIAQACSNKQGSDYDSCSQGFTGAKKNKSKTDSCKGAKNQDACNNGWIIAQGRLDPGTVSQAIRDSCKDNKDNKDAYNACLIGFQGGSSGDSKDVCGLVVSDYKSLCEDSFTKGQQQNNSNDTKDLGCDVQLTNALTWIICPLVEGMTSAIEVVDHLITDQLTVNTNNIFCDNDPTCKAYHAAWASFRNIALGFMVLAGLIIVISQALGLELLDAYMMRKTLPRLLLAAVGITLSWPIMQFMVVVSNDLGIGIRHLIYAPFSQLKNTADLSFGNGIASIFGEAGVLGVGGFSAWVLLGGPMALLAWAGTAALAVFIAIVILILRQVAIILLIILAPIAIVAYVLPNTQRIYKLWWESFIKALMMFLIISAFIASGRVFSAVSISNPSGGPLNSFIGIGAYFAPYFLIPMTLKLSGGAMRSIGGFVNDRSQGGFNALRGARSNTRKNRLERVRGQGLYRGANKLTRGLNKLGHYTLNADEQIPYKLGTSKALHRATGGLSGALFGRMAEEMAGKKAGQFSEQNAEALKQADLHYSTGWAILGTRDKLKKDLTPEGLDYMDKTYGERDSSGKLIRNKDGEVARWTAVGGADFKGLKKRGEELRRFGKDGSFAQIAGRELQAKAGILSSFGLDMKTQRANAQTVAATAVAAEGKMSGAEAARIATITGKTFGADSEVLGAAFEAAQLTQLERAGAQNNPALRRSKNIRRDKDSNLYAAHGDSMIDMVGKDGSVALDEDNNPIQIEAYKSKEAYDAATSLKSHAASGAKADHVTEMSDTLLSYVNGDRPDLTSPEDIRDMKQAIAYQASNMYSGDADVRNAYAAIRDQMNLSPQEQAQLEQQGRAQAEEEARHGNQQGGGGGGGGLGLGPGSIPGAGGIPGAGLPQQ